MKPSSRSGFIEIESALTADGYSAICGVDEAGRGPLAGPVVAAAVILDDCGSLDGLADSKLLTPRVRERLFDDITASAVAVGVSIVSSGVIDRDNILQATFQAMRASVADLRPPADFVLVDGLHVPAFGVPHKAVVRGDRTVRSIAAASIIAKVTRDRLMAAFDLQYPGYGFAKHKGYCTEGHVDAIRRLGRCPIHRMSYRVPGLEEIAQ